MCRESPSPWVERDVEEKWVWTTCRQTWKWHLEVPWGGCTRWKTAPISLFWGTYQLRAGHCLWTKPGISRGTKGDSMASNSGQASHWTRPVHRSLLLPKVWVVCRAGHEKEVSTASQDQHWRWRERKPVCANRAPGKWAGWGWTDKVELPTPSPKHLWKSGKVKGMQSKICALATSFLRASNGVKLRYLPGDAFTMYCNVKQYSTMKSPMIILVCPRGCYYYGVKEKYELDTDVIGKWKFP